MTPKIADWEIGWKPRAGGRKPEVASDPKYPNGIDLFRINDVSNPSCRGELPYPVLWPEHGLGILIIACNVCGMKTVVTTAGRLDDPRSLTLNCKIQ